jgi:hypothetical protein
MPRIIRSSASRGFVLEGLALEELEEDGSPACPEELLWLLLGWPG